MLRKQFSAKDQKSDTKSHDRQRLPPQNHSPSRDYQLIKVKEVMTLNRSRARLDQTMESSKVMEGPSEAGSSFSRPALKSRMSNPKRYTTNQDSMSPPMRKSVSPLKSAMKDETDIVSRYRSVMESNLARYDTQKTPDKKASLLQSAEKAKRQIDFPELPTQKNLQTS